MPKAPLFFSSSSLQAQNDDSYEESKKHLNDSFEKKSAVLFEGGKFLEICSQYLSPILSIFNQFNFVQFSVLLICIFNFVLFNLFNFVFFSICPIFNFVQFRVVQFSICVFLRMRLFEDFSNNVYYLLGRKLVCLHQYIK